MAEPEQAIVVRGGKGGVIPPESGRFKRGVCPNTNGRRGNRPPVELGPTAQELAAGHVPRAIERLAELMEMGGRNAGVARAACSELIKLACPDLTEETIARLVTEKLQALVADAEAARAAQETKP